MAKLEHLVCPKVGGGAQTHLWPPIFESAGHKPPLPPPPPFPLSPKPLAYDVKMIPIHTLGGL